MTGTTKQLTSIWAVLIGLIAILVELTGQFWAWGIVIFLGVIGIWAGKRDNEREKSRQ